MLARLCTLLLLLCSVAVTHAADLVTIGEVRRVHSKVLDEDRDYRVALPASYAWAKDRRYPVLYVLDGADHFAHSASSVDYLARQGEIPEMIVVALTSTNRIRDFTQTDWPEMWVGGGGAGNFKRFLANELIPDVERNFRAEGFRVLTGHSASGQFVLHCLSTEPDLFKGYVALSPSLDWDAGLPQRELQKAIDAKQKFATFIYVARSDDSGKPLADFDLLVSTLKTKAPNGLRWHAQAWPEETHGSIALLGQIDALRHVYAGYRFHNDMREKGLAYAEEHFRTVSKTVGWPIAMPEQVLNDFGYNALQTGKTDDAIALFKRNVAANPSSPNAHDSLADGHAEAKQWQQAIAAAQRALELAAPDHPNRSYFAEHVKKLQEQASAPDAES